MAYMVLMQYLKALQDLTCDRFGVDFCHRPTLFDVLTQIPMGDILHREVDCILILKPTEKLGEEIGMLIFLLLARSR